MFHCSIIQSDPEKNAQSLMHHHSVTVCSRITRFPPKNAQERSLSTSQCKICTSWLNILW